MSRPRSHAGVFALAFATLIACRAADPPKADDAAPSPPPPATPNEPEPRAAGELAYLVGHDDQDRIIAEARTEAEKCDAGDQRGCRALGNRYEEGIGAPPDRARALALYRRGCDKGSAYDCTLAGWLLTATRDADELAQGIEALRRACELDQLHACVSAAALLQGDQAAADEVAALRARACRGGYGIACDAGIEPSTQAQPTPSAHAVCPANFHWSTSQSGGPRLHGTMAQLDHEAMLAAIPTTLPGLEATHRSSTPAGRAGTRTAVASAEFEHGEQSVSLTVIDRAADCTLQPGTGAAMVDFVSEDRGGQKLEYDGWPAVLGASKGGPEATGEILGLTIWVADRCSVSVAAIGLDEPRIRSVAEHFDLDGLRTLCSQRPQSGMLGAL
jgi:hypothetical protein